MLELAFGALKFMAELWVEVNAEFKKARVKWSPVTVIAMVLISLGLILFAIFALVVEICT